MFELFESIIMFMKTLKYSLLDTIIFYPKSYNISQNFKWWGGQTIQFILINLFNIVLLKINML